MSLLYFKIKNGVGLKTIILPNEMDFTPFWSALGYDKRSISSIFDALPRFIFDFIRLKFSIIVKYMIVINVFCFIIIIFFLIGYKHFI